MLARGNGGGVMSLAERCLGISVKVVDLPLSECAAQWWWEPTNQKAEPYNDLRSYWLILSVTLEF